MQAGWLQVRIVCRESLGSSTMQGSVQFLKAFLEASFLFSFYLFFFLEASFNLRQAAGSFVLLNQM